MLRLLSIGFALLCSLIGEKISRHLLNQSDIKPKPIPKLSKQQKASLTCLITNLA